MEIIRLIFYIQVFSILKFTNSISRIKCFISYFFKPKNNFSKFIEYIILKEFSRYDY